MTCECHIPQGTDACNEKTTTTTTLHDLLLYNDPVVRPPSLTARSNVCLQLAKAILFTYDIEIVHKIIRPPNILLISPEDDRIDIQKIHIFSLGAVFVTNWQSSRSSGDATRLVGSKAWQQGIYQHPQRQGNRATEYVMGHDIYSLGVCMLEILLWKTFVDENNGTTKVSQLYQDRVIKLQLVQPDFMGNTQAMMKIPRNDQKVLVDIAGTELPAAAGDKMTDLVVNCFTCLEDGFGGQFVVGREDEAKTIRLRYILDVLSVFST